jgi:phytol kinase
MKQEVLYIIYFMAAFLGLFASAELIYLFGKVKAGITRKIVHVGSGLITLLFPFYLTSHWSALFLSASFFALLLLSMKFNFLNSINGVERKTWGSLLYPCSVYLSFFSYVTQDNPLYFFLPMLILAFSDTVAEILGKKLNWKPFLVFNHRKTIGGSLGFFFTTLIISFLLINYFTSFTLSQILIFSIIISLFTTFSEAISPKGIDNISVPSVALITLFLFDLYLVL